MLDDVRVTDPFGPLPGPTVDEPPLPEPPADESPSLTPRAVTQAVATVATAILLAGTMAMVGVPYVVDSPGPTLDTLGEYNNAKLIVVDGTPSYPVSYTHLRAHETRHDLVCRLLLEKKKTTTTQ